MVFTEMIEISGNSKVKRFVDHGEVGIAGDIIEQLNTSTLQFGPLFCRREFRKLYKYIIFFIVQGSLQLNY